MRMKLIQLPAILYVDCSVVRKPERNTIGRPSVVLDAGIVRLHKLLKGLLKLSNVKAFIVDGQACQSDRNIRMTPFRSRRWNAFCLVIQN